MIKFVTLLAVADICPDVCCEGDDPRSTEPKPALKVCSSNVETLAVAAAALLFLPKPSLHLDGFFVIRFGPIEVVAGGGDIDKIEEGKAFTLRGSNTLKSVPAPTFVGGTPIGSKRTEAAEEVLLALLISLANDCDAAARFRHVSFCKVVGLVEQEDIEGVAEAEPLPFRSPRFRRLVVEAEREDDSTSSCLLLSSSASSSLSRMIESSSLSNVGSNLSDGARESDGARFTAE